MSASARAVVHVVPPSLFLLQGCTYAYARLSSGASIVRALLAYKKNVRGVLRMFLQEMQLMQQQQEVYVDTE
jgi:hypothetical protein